LGWLDEEGMEAVSLARFIGVWYRAVSTISVSVGAPTSGDKPSSLAASHEGPDDGITVCCCCCCCCWN
jgi:hypothetical protein